MPNTSIQSVKLILLFIALIFLCSKCSSPEAQNKLADDPSIGKERPMEPWVFRSVLDKKPRMITIALDQELYVAYDTQNSALYKAWKGSVDLDGAVYTTYHGPQPTSIGNDYFINEYKQPWTIYLNEQPTKTTTQYLGHRFEKGEVILMYELTADNKKIKIEEAPIFSSTSSAIPTFERTFNVTGLPVNYTIGFKTNYASLLDEDQGVQTNGQWRQSARDTKELQLNTTGETSLSLMLGSPTIINTPNEESAELTPVQKLFNANDCRSCHNEKVKTVGPSYVQIAEKYSNNASTIAALANKVRYGGVGVWGESVMNAHPEIPEDDLNAMISYIMELDADEEAIKATLLNDDPIQASELITPEDIDASTLTQGLVTEIFSFEGDKNTLAEIDLSQPDGTDILDFVDLSGPDFGSYQEKFAFVIIGYLKVDSDKRVILRVASDDGSKLYLGDSLVIDNDGLHGTTAVDTKLTLAAGYHPIKLKFFENGGGQALYFQWRTEASGEFVRVPPTALFHKTRTDITKGQFIASNNNNPGDRVPLVDVHPSYDLSQARPDDFEPKVGGLDFLSDGRAVVSTWDALGAVYIVSGVSSGDPSKMSYKRIATGLAEPLGLKVVDDVIYIMQKQEMTKLIDNNNDDYIDEYQVLSNDWEVTGNFHEFGFGLEHKDGAFYATLATGIQPGGASALNQPKDRGSVIRVNAATGATEILANGLRTPNGVGIGVDNEIFIADNEGDWIPSSKILHVNKDDWYGSRSVDFEGTAGLKEKKPVVWLPQNEIGNSPSTPTYINDGPYQGQMIHGEVTHGGIKRVYVEKVNGAYQGCVFRFIQGLEAGVNRLRWGPDGALYVGGIGSSGNWQQDRKRWFGLQRLKYNGKSTFELLSVSARTNGIELKFTEPLSADSGNSVSDYQVKQWYYLPTENYGGPKMEETSLAVVSVNVSEDRTKAFLQLDGMKENHVIYVHLPANMTSTTDQSLWSTEAWYTMNAIPKNNLGPVPAIDPMQNKLTAAEKAAGWELLFDGKTTKGWRNYRKSTIGNSWKVYNGELTLMVMQKDDGGWQAADGGDIITDKIYEDYELQLEWKISDCGNSGIIYKVHESNLYDYVWQTGPEMQILDNKCHPDAEIKTHRAGDLYDMISSSKETTKGANQWNKVRLVIKDGKTEHWLNGQKVVEYDSSTSKWKDMIAASKFKDMKGFGSYSKGHIALQDHGDRVAFRNIKIREL